jgi:hypothetical protein
LLMQATRDGAAKPAGRTGHQRVHAGQIEHPIAPSNSCK